MLIETGIMLGSYLGLRLYEKSKQIIDGTKTDLAPNQDGKQLVVQDEDEKKTSEIQIDPKETQL